MKETIRNRVITLRVTEAFQRQVRDAAEADGRTVTSYIVNAINARMFADADQLYKRQPAKHDKK